jgi:hypothetical protein
VLRSPNTVTTGRTFRNEQVNALSQAPHPLLMNPASERESTEWSAADLPLAKLAVENGNASSRMPFQEVTSILRQCFPSLPEQFSRILVIQMVERIV